MDSISRTARTTGRMAIYSRIPGVGLGRFHRMQDNSRQEAAAALANCPPDGSDPTDSGRNDSLFEQDPDTQVNNRVQIPEKFFPDDHQPTEVYGGPGSEEPRPQIFGNANPIRLVNELPGEPQKKKNRPLEEPQKKTNGPKLMRKSLFRKHNDKKSTKFPFTNKKLCAMLAGKKVNHHPKRRDGPQLTMSKGDCGPTI